MYQRFRSHAAAIALSVSLAPAGLALESPALSDPWLEEEPAEEELLEVLLRQVALVLADLNGQQDDAPHQTIAAPALPPTPPLLPNATSASAPERATPVPSAANKREQAVAEIKAQAAADHQSNQKRYEEAKATATKRRDAQQSALSGYTPLNGYRRVKGGVPGDFAATQAALTKAYEKAKAEIDATERDKTAELEAALSEEHLTGAQLTWTIPETRINGAPLPMSELVGYEIYYTQLDGTASGIITIGDGTQNAHVVSGLQPGRYFFAISALDITGLKSNLSPMIEAAVGPH